MHSVIQRGADVHALLQSYDKHSYGAISGVLRVDTLYEAATVIIERGLIPKRDWNLIISPYLLRKFGTREQFADVHKLYPAQKGIEYSRFVEWAAAPLPDYHHNPQHGVKLKNVTMRGAPLLGADRPVDPSPDDTSSDGGPQLSNGYGDVGGWGSGTNKQDSGFLSAFGDDGGESQFDNEGRPRLAGKSSEAQKQAELKAKAGRRGGGAARRRALHKKKLSKTRSNGYGQAGVTGTGQEDNNLDYDEFGNEMRMVEGDFTQEDAAYFHDLSLSFNVGTYEAAQKGREKKTEMEEAEIKKNMKGGNETKTVDEKTNEGGGSPRGEEAVAVPESMPGFASNESERPSSQGAMFLPPALAREAAGIEAGMGMGMEKNDGALAAAGLGTGDVWTWDDEQDGGGDSFFGGTSESSPGEAYSASLASGGGPQPKPPMSMPPRNALGRSPMQKRVVR